MSCEPSSMMIRSHCWQNRGPSPLRRFLYSIWTVPYVVKTISGHDPTAPVSLRLPWCRTQERAPGLVCLCSSMSILQQIGQSVGDLVLFELGFPDAHHYCSKSGYKRGSGIMHSLRGKGTTISVEFEAGPLGAALSSRFSERVRASLSTAISEIICSVLPRPISSARMPPRQAGGGTSWCIPVTSLV